MNPVVSYKDIIDFMHWSQNNKDCFLPVILIKPETVLRLNSERRLDRIFNYFDRRSREDVQFFLPGYAHYPCSIYSQLLSTTPPYNKDTVALNLERLQSIHYSNNDFIEFIELIEKKAVGFRYYGDAELLFMKYVASKDGVLGHFDFNSFYRYNLSRLYYSRQENFWYVEHFLEEVLHIIRCSNNDNEMFDIINSIYLE